MVATDVDMNADMAMMGMPTSFTFSSSVQNFMFKGWTTHNTTEFVCTCLAMAVLAVVAEVLSFISVVLNEQSKLHPLEYGILDQDTTRSSLVEPLLIPVSIQEFRKRKILYHTATTFVRVFHLVIGYVLMLAVMTYNASIGIAVVLGCGLGYFIFGALRTAYAANMAAKRRNLARMRVQDTSYINTGVNDMVS